MNTEKLKAISQMIRGWNASDPLSIAVFREAIDALCEPVKDPCADVSPPVAEQDAAENFYRRIAICKTCHTVDNEKVELAKAFAAEQANDLTDRLTLAQGRLIGLQVICDQLRQQLVEAQKQVADLLHRVNQYESAEAQPPPAVDGSDEDGAIKYCRANFSNVSDHTDERIKQRCIDYKTYMAGCQRVRSLIPTMLKAERVATLNEVENRVGRNTGISYYQTIRGMLASAKGTP